MIATIESQKRFVKDTELIVLSRVLKATVDELLFP